MRALYLLIPLAVLLALLFFLRGPATSQGPGPSGLDPTAEAPTDLVPTEPDDPELVSLREPDQEVRTETQEPVTIDLRDPLEIELFLLQPGAPSSGDQGEVRGGAKATLRGRLHDDKGNPLQGSVLFLGGSNRGREIFCAEDGTFLAGDLYPGLGVVRVSSGRGHTSEREVRLGQFGYTELNLAFGMRAYAQVTGRVQDNLGRPLQGAKVRVDGQEVLADENGQFTVYQVTAGKILVQVSAEGFAHYREELPIARGAKVEAGRLVFQLEPEAILDLEVLGAGGEALVFLFPAGGQRVNTQRGQRTFPWHVVNPIQVRPGAGVSIRSLPSGTVTVMGFQNGLSAEVQRQNVKLNPGRRSTSKVQFLPGPTLRGQASLDGKPLAGAKVRLESLDAHQASMQTLGRGTYFANEMVIDILPSAEQQAVADSQGRFALTATSGVSSDFVLWAYGADGKSRGVRYLKASELDGEVKVDLQPIEDGQGSLVLDMPGVGQSLPYRVRINGVPAEVLVLQVGEAILIPELAQGLWRLDVSRRQTHVERGQRFWVGEDQRVQKVLVLDEDLWAPRR